MTKNEIKAIFLNYYIDSLELKPLLENEPDFAEFYDGGSTNAKLCYEAAAEVEKDLLMLVKYYKTQAIENSDDIGHSRETP